MLSCWTKLDDGKTQKLQTRLIDVTVAKVDEDNFHVSFASPEGIIEPKSMTIRTESMDEAKKSILSYAQVKTEDVRKKALGLSILLGNEIRKLSTDNK